MLIHRAITTTFLRILLTTVLCALVLFTLVDLLDHIGSFLDNEATLGMMGRYYLYRAPWIIDVVLPIAMLMATLFTVGSMARYNELTALFAAGRSLLQVTRPLLAMAVLASIFSFAWSEFVLPRANSASRRIWEIEVHRRPDRLLPTSDIAMTGADGRLYYARTFIPETGAVRGMRVHGFAGAEVVERWDADRAEWDGVQWILHQGTRRTFARGSETEEPFADLASGLSGITPESFRSERVVPENMTARRLRRHIAVLRRSGNDVTEFTVDLQFKLSFPVVHMIVVFLGILLASGPRKTTVASGFGWTILISFGYYLSMNFGRALGHSGALPPLPAAWAGNAAYATIAAILYARARR